MEAYCVKCRTKREVIEPTPEFNAVGAPVTRGKCGVCGTSMYRIGRTPLHEGMTPPEKKSTHKRSGKLVSMPYWSVPDIAIDDPDELTVWARKSYAAGLRSAK